MTDPRKDRAAEGDARERGAGALALLSGGLDSAVAVALHLQSGGTIALGLFVDYGQRAVGPEERAARAVGAALGFPLRTTTLPLLAEVTRTALVSDTAALPRPDPADLEQGAAASADAVWVPNRNALLVNLAAALAEAEGLGTVIVGFNAEEAVTFPDNSEPFLRLLDRCLDLSTRGTVGVSCPTLSMTKAEIWSAGIAAGLPLALTWSCYEGGDEPCGTCESCRRRERARQTSAR